MSRYPLHTDPIRIWAFDLEATHEQDWDLILTGGGFDELLVDLAADLHCPTCGVFLGCLYLLVGDLVRSLGRTQTPEQLAALFARAERTDDPELRLWVARSRDLISHPEKFDYAKWCLGGILLEGLEDLDAGLGASCRDTDRFKTLERAPSRCSGPAAQSVGENAGFVASLECSPH
jgi:hypothetical protein